MAKKCVSRKFRDSRDRPLVVPNQQGRIVMKVFGPYPHRGKWRILIHQQGRVFHARTYNTVFVARTEKMFCPLLLPASRRLSCAERMLKRAIDAAW